MTNYIINNILIIFIAFIISLIIGIQYSQNIIIIKTNEEIIKHCDIFC